MTLNFNPKLLIIFSTIVFATCVHAEIKFLSVVFRHADRAPDNNGLEIYPNDPYANDSFLPMGLGGLTNNGKLREYNLGAHIRKTYDKFLGDIYYPWEIKARSTNYDRTKMSLQLVLAALYQSKNVQKWKIDLDWQPIPATYVVDLDDVLMVPEECPRYLKAREQVETSPEFQAKLESFANFMYNLTIATGKNISNSNDMYYLYHALMAEKSMNLPLPNWTKNIFPRGRLLDGINLEYEIFSYNTEMRRLNGGMLLRKFTDDMTNYKNRVLDQRNKLFLYSGHETNVVSVLQALGVYTPHVPEYSSAVFVELHEEHGEYYVKAKYYKGIPSAHEELVIPGCGKKCTLNKFKEVLSNVIPSDEETRCDKRSLRDAIENGQIMVPSGITNSILNAIKKEEKMRYVLQ